MSKLNVTTQDLFLRLGATSMTRSTKADALFRRLRFNEQDQIASVLTGAPRRIQSADFDGVPVTKSRNEAAESKAIR
ncbi:MAG: hypothetical protein GXP04_08480 [Alphaproteobacteria bacterium]|nr:hypothetical protein [Alphaproteobacteria bacterium]